MEIIKHTEVGKSFMPRVSISPVGMISLSDAACRKYKIGDFKYAILYFAPKERVVVIELTNTEQEGIINIRKRTTGAYVAAGSFIGKFDIAIEATTIYDLMPYEEENFYMFDLGKGLARKSGKDDEEE